MDAAELSRQVLLALAVIVAVTHVAGVLMTKIGQPRVLGQILAGIALGPSVLGAVWPAATGELFSPEVVEHLRPIADLGLVLFMFLVGLELRLGHLDGSGKHAVVVSHVSIAAPFALGAGLAVWLHGRTGPGNGELLAFSLFIGAAMAVTAFPVLARILQETGLDRSRVGVMALACAAVDDVTAWCILAAVLAVARDAGAGPVSLTIAAAVVYVSVMWFLVRPLLRRFVDMPLAPVVGLALISAWVTDVIGVHAIFGGFVAGAVMPRRREEQATLVDRLEAVTTSSLLPVFFVIAGLSTQFGLLDRPSRWGFALAVVAVAVIGKLGGAGLAARAVGEDWRNALTIGVLMNTRGLTEIVILSVALERRIIGPTMFTIMVIMALATTIMAIPLMRIIWPTRIELDGGTETDDAIFDHSEDPLVDEGEAVIEDGELVLDGAAETTPGGGGGA